MYAKRVYYFPTSEWDRRRSRAYIKAKNQAKFRNEIWALTYDEWCEFYPDEASVNLRGRNNTSWCLTRRDPEGAWNRTNTCMLPRLTLLTIKNRRMVNKPHDELFEEARWI